MIIDTVPYLIVFGLGSWNVYINAKNLNNFFFFILFLFSAFRYDVGYDYMSYYELIKYYDAFKLLRIEPIERELITISHKLFIQLFFIINSFITIYFTKWALERKSRDISISALVFLCFPLMFTNSFSIIRFWSGLAIVFYASTYLNEKKYLTFLFLTLCAIGFHKSMIIAILYIPLYLINIPLIINILFLICSFVGGEFILSKLLEGVLPEALFADDVMRYTTHEGADGLSKIPYLYLILDIYFLFMSKRLKNASYEIYKWVTIFNFGVGLIFLLSFQTTLATRLCRPFLIYVLLLMPFLIEYKSETKKFRKSKLYKELFSITCLVLFVYLLTIYNESLGKSQFLPYQVFFL